MLKSKFESYLNFLQNKSILITSHALADLDGISSAIALYFFLNDLLKNIEIHLYFSKISKKASLFLDKLREKFSEFEIVFEEDLANLYFDVIFIVDANKISKVGKCFSTSKSVNNSLVVFIDHHYLRNSDIEEERNRNMIVFENYSSTSEIMVDLYNEFKVPLIDPLKYLLIAGILTDSAYLKFANQHTYLSIASLLEGGINYQEILSMLKVEPDMSEKIARIKGMQRVELVRENNWLVGVSHVSSFEATVANTLIKLGFDISIVLSERKDHYRISLRAKKKVCNECNLHLGKVLEEISMDRGATGGGHEGAASIKISKEEVNIRHIILEKIKEILN